MFSNVLQEQCMMMCKNGFRVDSDGCELCECVDQGQVRCPQCEYTGFHGNRVDSTGMGMRSILLL